MTTRSSHVSCFNLDLNLNLVALIQRQQRSLSIAYGPRANVELVGW